MACNLATNFEVALIKKLWKCSVLSPTLRVRACLSITFAFSGYSRSVETRNCRSDHQIIRNRNPNRSNRKTENRIRKTVSIFRENRKKKVKNGKSVNCNEKKNEKPKFFGTKTDLKNSQNRKTKGPNASHPKQNH